MIKITPITPRAFDSTLSFAYYPNDDDHRRILTNFRVSVEADAFAATFDIGYQDGAMYSAADLDEIINTLAAARRTILANADRAKFSSPS